ncbi:MAG: HIT domain-containing protein [Burkholderiaceae bacterium]
MKALLIGVAASCMLLIQPLLAHTAQVAGKTVSMPGWTEAPYNLHNPFARIIRGELPAYKVYEDAHVLAFLSLDQNAAGHVLAISKNSKAQNIMEMSPQDLLRVMRVAQRVARAEAIALHADGVVIQQNNGAAGGQTVFHLHVHVIPHWNGRPPDFARDDQGRLDRQAIAARIAAAMSN